MFGGEYSLFPALYGGWGLRSFIDLHAGIYGANADYNGHFVGRGIGGSKLGLSDDQVTFIGGVKFETRKQFSPRTSLLLLSEYDWYSWVPAMRYNDGDGKSNGIDTEPTSPTAMPSPSAPASGSTSGLGRLSFTPRDSLTTS